MAFLSGPKYQNLENFRECLSIRTLFRLDVNLDSCSRGVVLSFDSHDEI